MTKIGKIFIRALVFVVALTPARADVSQSATELARALEFRAMIEIMADEGLAYGGELADEMFAGRNSGQWADMISAIYDRENMAQVTLQGFSDALVGVDTKPLIEFFQSDLGRRIVALELSARRALMDDAVDEANKIHVAQLIAAQNPRLRILQEFIAINDLLEYNVVGALNSNFAFYSALVASGSFGEPRTESQILNDVWQQEDEIRADTAEWLIGFLSLAYQPLSDAEMDVYIQMSKSPEGQALNAALFAAFDKMFNQVSRNLGTAAAQMMVGEDL